MDCFSREAQLGNIRGRFLVYRELSAILDAQLFPTFFRPNSWAPFLRLLPPTFYRTLWTVKVNFIVKKKGAVALNYLYLQEIYPRWHKIIVPHGLTIIKNWYCIVLHACLRTIERKCLSNGFIVYIFQSFIRLFSQILCTHLYSINGLSVSKTLKELCINGCPTNTRTLHSIELNSS